MLYSAAGRVLIRASHQSPPTARGRSLDAPIISTRSVQTKLLIRDGQTIVLGGLTDRQHEVSQGGIPLLSSIPLIGGLFGHARRTTTGTELFLFLTPRIIRDDEDADLLTNPLRRKAEKIRND